MFNNFPQIAYVYNRHKKASSQRKASIEIRVTYKYKQKYISTGIMVFPNQWKNDRIVNCQEAEQYNIVIDDMADKIRKVIFNMIREGNVDIFSIPKKLEEMNASQETFISFCRKRATVRKYGKSEDSQNRYDRFLTLFMKWGKITEFSDITDSSIIDYDEYLISQGMKPYSKWNNYHRFLNSFIIDAINEGLLSKNPYKWVNINRGKNTKGIERCLVPDEFIRLKNSPMPTPCIDRVRDLFVFQVYTCLSYADLRDFDASTIVEIKGLKVYLGNRHKTSKSFTIPLVPQALGILEKYNGELPVISNVKYNAYLKIVAQSSGIDKPISSHWARHTGATMLLNDGIDMKIVSKICGHSSTKITEQIYAKLLDETVVDAINSLYRNKSII